MSTRTKKISNVWSLLELDGNAFCLRVYIPNNTVKRGLQENISKCHEYIQNSGAISRDEMRTTSIWEVYRSRTSGYPKTVYFHITVRKVVHSMIFLLLTRRVWHDFIFIGQGNPIEEASSLFTVFASSKLLKELSISDWILLFSDSHKPLLS